MAQEKKHFHEEDDDDGRNAVKITSDNIQFVHLHRIYMCSLIIKIIIIIIIIINYSSNSNIEGNINNDYSSIG